MAVRPQKQLKVVILAGGLGTRLREETEFRPKPMVQIGRRPILWHIMKIYSHYGYSDFVILLGYRGEVIKDYFLRYDVLNNDVTIELGPQTKITPHGTPDEYGWRTTLVDTGVQAMTGARIKRAQKYIDTDPFLLTYGDGVADIDINALVRFHEQHGKIATVTGVAPPPRFGELIVEGDRAIEFSEKPQPMGSAFINGGFFVMSRRIFDYLEDTDGCVLEGRLLKRLAREGQLMVYAHHGFWQCMDTLRDVTLLNELWDSERPPWRIWDSVSHG